MSREARTLLLLGVFALGAVAVLGSIAKRYGTMLGQHDAAAPRGARVEGLAPIDDAPGAGDAFADVRSAMHGALARRAPDATVEATLSAARDQSIAALGFSVERYTSVREAYRRWRIGAPLPEGLAEVFESREARLGTSDLGAYESLDR